MYVDVADNVGFSRGILGQQIWVVVMVEVKVVAIGVDGSTVTRQQGDTDDKSAGIHIFYSVECFSNVFLFLNQFLYCDHSLGSSYRDNSNEWSPIKATM